MQQSTYIIAEAGVNHNGDPGLAMQLVKAAAEAGADAVKFQTFKAASLVTEKAEKADYQKQTTGGDETQFAMLKRLELSYELHHELIRLANQLDIEFLSTAFDAESLKFLVDDLGLKTLKIPSGEITNAPLVLAHARTGCDLIVSTGMATLSEVEAVLGVIAFGLTAEPDAVPGQDAFVAAYLSTAGQQTLKEKVILLHCTTEYPAPFVDINLRAMDTLASSFGLRVGYSDHSDGLTVPIAATARGACLIEKHFTLDKTLEGPDHKASLAPKELSQMVKAIRHVGQALGNGIKGPQPSELKNRAVARKSLVTTRNIEKGEAFTKDNVGVMRPGNGLSPMGYWGVIGQGASRDYETGEVIYG